MSNRIRTVFARNLNYSVNENELKSFFEHAGEVEKVELFFGFAYIMYKTSEEAKNAISLLNNTVFKDKQIDLEFFDYDEYYPDEQQNNNYKIIKDALKKFAIKSLDIFKDAINSLQLSNDSDQSNEVAIPVENKQQNSSELVAVDNVLTK